jgi:hypothetical protein
MKAGLNGPLIPIVAHRCPSYASYPARVSGSLSFLHSELISPTPKDLNSSLFSGMADLSGTARFQVLFENALQAYEEKTGLILAQHPLTAKLQSCVTAEDITTFLQGQAQAFDNFQVSDRITRLVKTTVSTLTALSEAASLADAVGLVCQKALMAWLTHLTGFSRHYSHLQKQYRLLSLSYLMYVLRPRFINGYHCDIQLNQTPKGVMSNSESLIELFESIEQFVNRLDIYIRIPLTPAMVEILVRIMVDILSTLALVTKDIKQGRPSKLLLAYMLSYSPQ